MGNKIEILYVEDNEGDVELLAMSIERYCSTLNIVLTIAETVEEAKEKFDANKHVMALVDWNLPDGEGIGVVKFIREKHVDIPIFLLSGVITEEHRELAEKYNPTDCLEKDYGRAFIERIEKVFACTN
jgi:DNA-binding response OmpR family regulator